MKIQHVTGAFTIEIDLDKVADKLADLIAMRLTQWAAGSWTPPGAAVVGDEVYDRDDQAQAATPASPYPWAEPDGTPRPEYTGRGGAPGYSDPDAQAAADALALQALTTVDPWDTPIAAQLAGERDPDPFPAVVVLGGPGEFIEGERDHAEEAAVQRHVQEEGRVELAAEQGAPWRCRNHDDSTVCPACPPGPGVVIA